MMYSPAWPHSPIQEVFPDIFFVTGTNITHHDNTELQHSRNMIIVRNDNELSLINTVRLTDKGLQELDTLGAVKNIIRIGAFHGRDDAFFLDRYHAKLWALKGMKHASHHSTDIELIPNGLIPFPNCSVYIFETSLHPEAVLHIAQQGGILITCDSIKNWITPDRFFSEQTAKLYQQQGFFGAGTISSIWQQATQTKATDFEKLKKLRFRHLLSAHGAPLLNIADKIIFKTIEQEYRI